MGGWDRGGETGIKVVFAFDGYYTTYAVIRKKLWNPGWGHDAVIADYLWHRHNFLKTETRSFRCSRYKRQVT